MDVLHDDDVQAFREVLRDQLRSRDHG